MSQKQKQNNFTNIIHNYSQSEHCDISDALNLINYVVEHQRQNNHSSKKTSAKRSRSNSSHSIKSPKSKVKSQSSNEHIIPSSPPPIDINMTTTTTVKNPVATHSPSFGYDEHSPNSISSSMDFDNEIPHSKPKFNTKLSTVLSIGILEQIENKIDNEIKTIENDFKHHNNNNNNFDLNHLSDIRETEECKKIMFLYNSKSGGQKALTLLKYFQQYTSLIYDLFTLNSSENTLHKLANNLELYSNKLVICIVGGDGSQCWAVSLIDKALKLISKQISYPTIVPFPVGTGNDLSRSLGWGFTERTNSEQIMKHISDVEYCFNISKRFSVLDRWNIKYNGLNSLEYNPPLPSQFLCYLSIGYDAMITYNFAQERKNNPHKFKSQLSNQTVYIKYGLKEFISPSNPVNNCIELLIDGCKCIIPENTRSLKLVNINSAASGVFFWGYLKSNKNELQNWKRPQLNDGLIEIMATKGSADLVKTKTKFGHAHRLGQSNDIIINIIKVPIYLQIDGEGYYIQKKCKLNIKLFDQLPTLIGYKYPRGVYHKYTIDYYNDKIKQSRHRYRNIIKMKYNIKNKNNTKIIQAIDDFNINVCDMKEKEEEIIDIKKKDKGNERNKSMSEIMVNNNKKKIKKWKPLFGGNQSWKRNKKDENKRKKHRRMSWF